MSSPEHLDALRKQNKELLQKLKHYTETRVNVDSSSKQFESETLKTEDVRKFARTRLTERNGSLLHVSDYFINLSVSENRAKVPRNALCKPKNLNEKRGMKTPDLAEVSSDEEAKHSSEDVLRLDQGNTHLHVHFKPKRAVQPKFIISKDNGQSVDGRVRFPCADDELKTASESERRRVQPLLGYDWIAGLLDAESSLTVRSEHFFNELRTFRQVNKEECVHGGSSWLPVETAPGEDDVTNNEHTPETHQCTFCYRINSRLFATPLDSQAACPVCRMPKEKHPHTENQPAFIRVSIPCTTLLPAYEYKAHRRCSFDPSDSLGLPAHCLSGWTNTSMGTGSKMSSLDLRSSVEIRPSAHPAKQLPQGAADEE
ncbi:migration and invasion inhibitory protein [Clarias gariepinus]|uniref:migration and invasion-inhibitory protein n=1 Tax=Clarias gariepinus TaxID=13013 RepID=UPI00234C5CBE|nr:migration and invasion-inhibitory protein [Clarias gariepinus]